MLSNQTDERMLREPAGTPTPEVSGEDEISLVSMREGGRLERIVTPRIVLFIFTALNFITYYDRGAIAGSLAVIKEDQRISGSSRILSDTQTGFIVSGFMIGFMTTSPIFAAFGGVISSKWMITAGMIAWGIACIGTALARSYVFLLICRIIVGVGEAAFVGYTVTIIDQIAPLNSRTLWIGTFYSMIPVGTAVGMALGGIISSFGVIGPLEGWRVVFLSEVLVAVPIVLTVVFLPRKYNLLQSSEEEYVPFHRATFALFKNPIYLLVVFGYAMYSFVVGAISVWAIPMLVQGPMQLLNLTASIIMGGVTAVTGVFGSVAGGILVDKMGGSLGDVGVMKCQLFDVLMIALCVPLGILALCMQFLPVFIPILVISVFALFAVTAPVNASILTVVPRELRTYAVSYSVFLIHAFGDFPSPTFVGLLSDRLFSKGCPNHDHDSCVLDTINQCQWVNNTKEDSTGHCVNEFQLRNALLVVFSILFLAIPSWLLVYLLLWRRRTVASSTTNTGNSSSDGDEQGYNSILPTGIQITDREKQ
ncbi:putative transporter [Trypanosoma theileri]|uniref:Putative transporter n=1 Tax=Trypanosoma theileri TaxID=67003 RepID=A0A1X0P6Q0_9TRYP|nr:putative transporter [Trypanosoma theileri]ORC92594.1 putative transporter [Trypanosoma theileri]